MAAGAESCSWCGAGTLGPDESTKVAPAAAPTTTPDIGFGQRSARKLPDMPPPPAARPFEHLNPGQVMLRTAMVIAIAYLVIVAGRGMLGAAKDRLCAQNPYAPQCLPVEDRQP